MLQNMFLIKTTCPVLTALCCLTDPEGLDRTFDPEGLEQFVSTVWNGIRGLVPDLWIGVWIGMPVSPCSGLTILSRSHVYLCSTSLCPSPT